MNSVVIIPALNPGKELPAYARSLLLAGLPRIVVVDDGSSVEYRDIFMDLADLPTVTVLRHKQNHGKGRALKTAIRHILSESLTDDGIAAADGVITVDADGQHAVEDVCRVASALSSGKNEVVLGCRDFSLPQVPFRSRLGNRTTSIIFRLLHGVYLPDTQTGLRGIPAGLLPALLRIEGERFDYEMNVLIKLLQAGGKFSQMPIETRYFDDNKGSHYRAWRDSRRVAGALLAGKSRKRPPGQGSHQLGGRDIYE